MSAAILGFLMGLPAMWLYSQLADLAVLAALKSQKRALMKQALTHTGNFAALLAMQKKILLLSLAHLRMVAPTTLISCSPVLLFLFLRPELATTAFFIGLVPAYLFAKWRWRV